MMKKNGPSSSYECLNREHKRHVESHRKVSQCYIRHKKIGLLCHNDLLVRPVAE